LCDSGAIGPTFDQAKKNHNKRFGEFEFKHFGDSDVMNKLKLILLGGDFSPKIFGHKH
jgi:hypothetical protein